MLPSWHLLERTINGIVKRTRENTDKTKIIDKHTLELYSNKTSDEEDVRQHVPTVFLACNARRSTGTYRKGRHVVVQSVR